MINDNPCLCCGGIVDRTQRGANNKKYCSEGCRDIANAERDRVRQAEWQKRKRQEEAMIPDENKVQCAICNLWYKQVGTHVVEEHGYITAREYREEHGFDVKRGQTRGEYRELKAKQVFETKTVNNLKRGKKYWFVKGDPKIGIYERSLETKKRLRKQGLKIGEMFGGQNRKEVNK